MSLVEKIREMPFDICHYILEYIDTLDIDMRIFYRIYRKIKCENFDIINSVIRVQTFSDNPYINRVYKTYHFVRNSESENNETRVIEHIEPDMIFFECSQSECLKKMKIKIISYKLKKNVEGEDYSHDTFYKGSLKDDYHWFSQYIKYRIE